MLVKLDTFFSRYGSYHNNRVNKGIHMLCIPMILWSGMGLMLFLNKQFYYEDTMYSINCATIFFTLLMSLYILIDLVGGVICTLFYGALYMSLNYLYYVHYLDQRQLCWNYLVYLNIASWIGQFIGHGFFEKRAPALMDNIFYAGIAPFFVVLEVFIYFLF